MTTPARIDFSSRFGGGPETLAVCVLVAGVPIVLVPAGTSPTATAVSSGTVDALWWPGVGALEYDLPGASGISPVRAWLDPGTTWERYCKSDPLKGDAKVETLTFDVHDTGGAATAVLSAPRARVAEYLTADVAAAATSIPIGSTSGVPSSGIAWLGREALIYDGVGGGALGIASAPAGRGKFGSRARSVRLNTAGPQLVSVGAWPRSWYGRLATVWLCRLSGTTLYDPTLIYAGTVGPEVRRSPNGMRWQITLDNVVEVLSRKLPKRSVTLSGFSHYDTATTVRAPLEREIVLGRATGAPHRGGFHEALDGFLRDWNARAVAAGGGVTAYSDGERLVVRQTSLGAGVPTNVTAAWNDPPITTVTTDASGVLLWRSTARPPEACVHMDGALPLFAPGDAARIPSVLAYASGDSTARYTLTAKCRNGDEVTARINAVDTSDGTPFVAVGALGDWADDTERQRATVIVKVTEAVLGVVAEGSSVVDCLIAAGLLMDAYDGGLHEDVIDWGAIARQFASVPLGGIPAGRRYVFGDGDTIVHALSHEARLRGMSLCTRNGRLSVFRTAVFAATEETVATITGDDVLSGQEPEVIDAPQPVATSIVFKLPGARGAYQWIDETSRAEHGDGETVECEALKWLAPDADLSRIGSAIQVAAQQVLGVLSEVYRIVRVALGPRYFGLQEGDLVVFSHPRVPNYLGTIGVTELTCQVQEARMQVFGGRANATVALRLQEPDLAGYAPEALVDAGGLSVGGRQTVITIDTSSGFGATCFSRATGPDGAARTNAVDGFTVGDKVVLAELNSRTPIADEPGTIVSIDTNTVKVNFAASAGMQTAAAARYGCVLRFADWTVVDAASAPVRDRQERYLYVADASTRVLGGGDPPKRWAA